MRSLRYAVEIGDSLVGLRRMYELGIKAQTCVTSPPYFGLRDYGHAGQIGLEQTPDLYINALVKVFRCVRDVLADDGTLWLNIGDSYDVPAKQLMMIPARVAIALQADGWILRQDIIWSKSNPMPEKARDRCANSHEHIFLLSKSKSYFFDYQAIREPAVTPPGASWVERKAVGAGYGPCSTNHIDQGKWTHGEYRDGTNNLTPKDGKRNRRSVWNVAASKFRGAHFATFPPALIEPCVLAGSRHGDTVIDPFGGSGTTAGVALLHGRSSILCELNQDYANLIPDRVNGILTRDRKIATPPITQLDLESWSLI